MKNKSFLPVLFGFFVMGFADFVGITSTYVQADFALSDTVANFLPTMLFVWFFFFSLPAGVLMNKISRKRTVILSLLITSIGLALPFLIYNYISILITFMLLGIGNTILQVSLNPLLSNVVSQDRLTSALTAGQFVKAISSFSGPLIVTLAALWCGSWKLMFPFFMAIAIISIFWLNRTSIVEKKTEVENVGFIETLSLLRYKKIMLLFIGIICTVSVDVGMNIMTPRLLMERCSFSLHEAGFGSSLYFLFRTIGALGGIFFLAKCSSIRFFRIVSLIAITALLFLIIASNHVVIMVLIAIVGCAVANIFSIIFGRVLILYPSKANPLSGLMIMGVSGGALIPSIMGFFNQLLNSQTGSIVAIIIPSFYLVLCSLMLSAKSNVYGNS